MCVCVRTCFCYLSRTFSGINTDGSPHRGPKTGPDAAGLSEDF